MRRVITGVIATLWGGGIVYRAHVAAPSEEYGDEAYRSGADVAVYVGYVLLALGLWELWRWYRDR